MKMWINAFRAELLKFKRNSLLWLHLIIPLAGAGIVYLYYRYSNHTAENGLFIYLTLVAAAYPFMISVVTTLSFKMEEESAFYHLLSAIDRKIIVSAKLFLLYISGCFTTILAEVLVPVLIGTGMRPKLFLGIFLVISIPNMILYILHSFLFLKYGKSISVFTGVCGTLVSMLFLTGLGDGIWKLVPYSMGVRATNLLLLMDINTETSLYHIHFTGFPLLCTVELVAVIIFFFCWVKKWEGRKVYE